MARGSSSGGGGRSSGSSHSSGSFSSSRSSHSFSSSGRSSSSNRSSSNRSSSSSFRRPSPPPPPRHSGPHYHHGPHVHHTHYYGGGPVYHRPYRSHGCLTTIVAGVIVLIMLLVVFSSVRPMGGNIPSSTVVRDKVTGYAYSDIIVDHTGELSSNHSKLSKALRYFYNETGVVPIVYLSNYNEYDNVGSEASREKYANEVFDEYAEHEASFLVMCFENEPNQPWLDYTMTIVGHNADSVMDDEALNIFEAYFRQAWDNESLSMDEVFIRAFENTADRIMQKTTTGKDVAKSAFVVLAIVVAIGGVVVVMVIRRKHKKQEHEEVKQILETPLETTDSTLDKYEDKQE